MNANEPDQIDMMSESELRQELRALLAKQEPTTAMGIGVKYSPTIEEAGYKLVPLEPDEERQKAFAKVWFKSGWSHWSTNKSADKERFNAAYKAMINVRP